MNLSTRPELALLGLGALIVVCITVLAALGTIVPDVLSAVLTFAVGGGAGATVPRITAALKAPTKAAR